MGLNLLVGCSIIPQSLEGAMIPTMHVSLKGLRIATGNSGGKEAETILHICDFCGARQQEGPACTQCGHHLVEEDETQEEGEKSTDPAIN
jgi:hypothetical protein